jgi:hypothetical protein
LGSPKKFFEKIFSIKNISKHRKHLNYRGWGKFQKFPTIVIFSYDFVAIKKEEPIAWFFQLSYARV